MTRNGTLSANQQKAIRALLTEKSVKDAAAACGLSISTLWRYLREDPFLQALRTEQTAIYTAATTRLTQGMDQALDELEKLIKNAKSEAVRRAAVADWLSQALKIRDFQEFEARLQALEERKS